MPCQNPFDGGKSLHDDYGGAADGLFCISAAYFLLSIIPSFMMILVFGMLSILYLLD